MKEYEGYCPKYLKKDANDIFFYIWRNFLIICPQYNLYSTVNAISK